MPDQTACIRPRPRRRLTIPICKGWRLTLRYYDEDAHQQSHPAPLMRQLLEAQRFALTLEGPRSSRLNFTRIFRTPSLREVINVTHVVSMN